MFKINEYTVYFKTCINRLGNSYLPFLRIDKGSPRGALYLGTCIHNNGSCNDTLYIL